MKHLVVIATVAVVLAIGLWAGLRTSTETGAEPRSEVDVETSEPTPAATPTTSSPTKIPRLLTGGVDRSEAELAYARAFKSQMTPGVAAFRVTTDAYVDYNMEDAKAKAAAEGITVDEVRELTYFGHLALRSQQWQDVQEILGVELSAEQKQNARAVLDGANTDFKAQMRELVKNGASEAERWELIRATQENYLKEYFAVTGLDANMLDRLLGGDFGGRKQAPALVSAEQADNLLVDVNRQPNPNPQGIGAPNFQEE